MCPSLRKKNDVLSRVLLGIADEGYESVGCASLPRATGMRFGVGYDRCESCVSLTRLCSQSKWRILVCLFGSALVYSSPP